MVLMNCLQGSNGDTDIENRPRDKCVGKEEEGEMNRENSVEAYTLPSVKQIADRNLLYDSGNSNWDSITT